MSNCACCNAVDSFRKIFIKKRSPKPLISTFKVPHSSIRTYNQYLHKYKVFLNLDPVFFLKYRSDHFEQDLDPNPAQGFSKSIDVLDKLFISVFQRLCVILNCFKIYFSVKITFILTYCMSKRFFPLVYSKYAIKFGQDFLDIWYHWSQTAKWEYFMMPISFGS